MTTIKANNININYRLEGEGKTIVFIHGLSDSLNYWKILQDDLKENYQTLSYDLRAHGDSGDDGGMITIDLYRKDLYYLLKALDIEKAVFIGLSLGGNIALNFAINHPEMVNGLIVMSSFSEFNDELKEIFDEFERGIDKGFEEFYDIILPYTLPKDVLERNREKLEAIKHNGAKTANIEGIKAGIKAGYSHSITDRLDKINAPAIVISGEEDDLTNICIQSKIHENINDCEMIILEKTKHNLLIGRNISRILEIIDKFMLEID
ncbi:MAG: alpha/beta hydrolase [Methanobrevibacter sp.]|nr:alpha/beta hydrolase [Methanobrevibacter sp.]